MPETEKELKVRELESKLTKQRADFIAALKHRMRTPVVAAIRICRLLHEDEYGPLIEPQRQMIAALLAEHCDLLQLIDVMEDIYSYQNHCKNLFMATVSIAPLVEELNREFHKQCGSKSLDCNVEEDSFFFGDRIEVYKLLWHLLDNAIEYGGSRIKFDVRSFDHSIEFSVEDNGIGISSEDIEWLFDRFYEFSSHGKYSAKTGTGLCLCAQIARAHKGSISCESKLGQGTKFVVTIPKYDTARQEQA